MTSPMPPDQPQETDPPDLDLMLSALRELLTDVSRSRVPDDLALRTAALRSVVGRMIEHRAERGNREL